MAQPQNLTVYGITNPLQSVFPSPIKAKRAPNPSDIGYQLGQVWIYVTNGSVYMLLSVIENIANWVSFSGGAGSFSSLTVNPGQLTVTAGNLILNTGSIGVVTGSIVAGNTVQANYIIGLNQVEAASGANFVALNGGAQFNNLNNDATGPLVVFFKYRESNPNGVPAIGDSLGSIQFECNYLFSGSVVGASITSAKTGNSGDGNIYPLANLSFNTNDGTNQTVTRMQVNAAGNVIIGIPDSGVSLTTEAGITASNGNIVSTLGAITGVIVAATGDLGGGVASTTILSNATVAATGSGAGFKVLPGSGAGTTASAGFIKMYVGTTPVYVPYWTQTT